MIGFYNYSVVLTYMSLISATIGITFALDGKFLVAVFCILISGLCDMFDGRVARAMKNRTDGEKSFGIQIDSLCDLVAFTVLPAIIAFTIGGNKIIATISGTAIILCGVIRLGFFNVLAINESNKNEKGEHVYHGLPVTTTALIVPFLFIFKTIFGATFPLFYHIALLAISLLFITNFTFVKPGKKVLYSLILVGAVIGAIAVFFNK